MLDSLLKEYSRTLIASQYFEDRAVEETAVVLHKINDYLKANKYKDELIIEDMTMAMCAFYDMCSRKIGGFYISLFSYFSCTAVANKTYLPQDTRLNGIMLRAFTTFTWFNSWYKILTLARTSPIGRYEGNLDEKSFFDILLLSDVYKVWNIDNDHPTLYKLKSQAPFIAHNYPNFTKQQIIKEGELANEALFNIVASIIVQFD
ncbi:MAG: hypothetical protein SOW01_05260 [Mediterranea sp.]|nr:hypothetical protein [Mediterranea sp.]